MDPVLDCPKGERLNKETTRTGIKAKWRVFGVLIG